MKATSPSNYRYNPNVVDSALLDAPLVSTCRLYWRLTTSISDSPYEKYTELSLNFRLPFEPSEGLLIHFDPVADQSRQQAYEASVSLSEQRYEIAVTVDCASDRTENVPPRKTRNKEIKKKYSLYAYRLCPSIRALEELREQAVLGYGFEQDMSEDDAEANLAKWGLL